MFASRSAHARSAEEREASPPTVAVDELRVGMFIHLEGGWLSHPFARSSFRIASEQQIATLRGLKIQRVRWSPQLSDAPSNGGGTLPAAPNRYTGADAGAGEHAAAPATLPVAPLAVPATRGEPTAPGAAAGTPAATSATTAAPAASFPQPTPEARRPAGPTAPRGPSGPTDPRAAARQAALATERQAQRQCEAHFGEASAAWRQASDALPANPAAARQHSEALAEALTAKLTIDGDIGIRLLPSAGNDRAAAHAVNVTVVSMLLARSLGIAPADIAQLALGALLHDVGKLELPERARHAEAGVPPAETAAYREHVARGVATAQRMALPEAALAVIAQHHECADGSGFPVRIGGERLTLASRIVALVNRYDNLCNPGTRTPPLTPHEAVAMLFAHGRTRHDASVLNAFIRMMGVYPAGSLVQLTDERYAMVVAVNSSRPLKPRVLVHESGVPRAEALLLDLEHEADLGIRRSLPAAKVPARALQYLDPRPRVAYFFEPLAAPGAATAAPAAARPAASAPASPRAALA